MILMYCDNCGKKIMPGQLFCTGCGQKVENPAYEMNQKRYCTHCGKEIEPSQIFCTGCGQQVGKKPVNNDSGVKLGMHDITSTINNLAGEGGDVDIDLKVLFSEVFKSHTKQEQEELFVCGTEKTTPKEEEIMDEWPKPWLYMRIFLVLALTFVCLLFISLVFNNSNGLPGTIFVGAMTIPFALVVFFWETNAPRNISLFEVVKLFFLGGALSLLSTLFIYSIVDIQQLDYVGAMLVGFCEEVGKGIVIYQFLKQDKYRYILNGLLIGSCIGAGFAVFETAGYAFNYLLAMGTGQMLDVLIIRGILALGGHVVWSAMVGGGIVINKTKNGALVQFLLIAIVLHAIWDMPITFGSDIFLVQILLTIAAWIIILTLIASGLKQVKRISNHYKKLKNTAH